MTRKYLSPTATTFVKIGLFLVECLIGLFNIVAFPIRKIGFKAYGFILVVSSLLYVVSFYDQLGAHAATFGMLLGGFTVGIFAVKAVHKLLNKVVSPKVALMMHAPFGIGLNRYYIPV